MVDFSGITLPFNVTDLLSTGMAIVKLFGPFILLGVVIRFAPVIIYLIKTAIAVKKGNDQYADKPGYKKDPIFRTAWTIYKEDGYKIRK